MANITSKSTGITEELNLNCCYENWI